MSKLNKILILVIFILLFVSGCIPFMPNMPNNYNPFPTPSPDPGSSPRTFCEMGPNQNIYFVNNYTLKKWDHSNGQISNVGSFENTVSSMVLGGSYLYISEGVKIWQYDISLGTLTHKFTTPATINSLYYIGGYLISNDQSGAWSTNRLIKLPEFIEKDSRDWLDPSSTYVNIESQNTVYILRDQSIPDDLCYQMYDKTTETLGTYGDSPYHGDYQVAHPLKQFDSQLKIIVGSGLIFDVSGTIAYDSNLGYSFNDLIFYGNKIYLLNQNNTSARLLVLNNTTPYSLINTPLNYANRYGIRLFVNGSSLIVVTGDNNNNVFVESHDFATL